MSDCSYDGCDREAKRNGYCWTHVKQAQRGQHRHSVPERPKTRLERLREAALAYAEADSDEDYVRASDNLRKAANSAGGRPRKLDPSVAVAMVVDMGSVPKAAEALRVNRRTIERAVRAARLAKMKGCDKTVLSHVGQTGGPGPRDG